MAHTRTELEIKLAQMTEEIADLKRTIQISKDSEKLRVAWLEPVRVGDELWKLTEQGDLRAYTLQNKFKRTITRVSYMNESYMNDAKILVMALHALEMTNELAAES